MRSVYRSQGLNFLAQMVVMRYASQLGVTNEYKDPILTALSNRDTANRHAYDQTNHREIEPLRGGCQDLRTSTAFVQHKLGGQVLIDWVANHTSDQHRLMSEHPEVYDRWQSESGQWHIANFFGLGWLPKLRIEDPAVFEETQGFLLDLAQKNGWLLRADHEAGFQDPLGIRERLQARGLKMVAETIIQEGEHFCTDDFYLGEVGYRPLDWLNRLIHNRTGVEALTESWLQWVADDPLFTERVPTPTHDAIMLQAKREAAKQHFGDDIERLSIDLKRDGHPEVTSTQIVEWLSELRQYRTYFWKGRNPNPADLEVIKATSAPEWFISSLVEGKYPYYQPLQAGVFAKGVEDRGLYRWTPVLSLNEVGGTPNRGWLSPHEFHERALAWTSAHPDSFVCLDTHDTKRSSGLRAALAAATHFPEEYLDTLDKLRKAASPFAGNIGPHAQRFIFDTMLGMGSCDPQCMVDYYAPKAAREAALATNWFSNNTRWEEEASAFIRAIASDTACQQIMRPMAERMDKHGRELLLSQQLLGLMWRGTFAFYNGMEGPDNKRLVDPHNRVPADFANLQRQLGLVKSGKLTDGCADLRQLALVHATLQAIHADQNFEDSPWEPVEVGPGTLGAKRGNLVAVVSVDGKTAKSAPCKGALDLLPAQCWGQGLFKVA